MNFNSSHRCARNRLFLDMTTQAIIGTQEGIKVINRSKKSPGHKVSG